MKEIGLYDLRLENLLCTDPRHPDNVFEIPCATSSLLTSTSSLLIETPSAGTLMGTWRTPKKVRASMAGIVEDNAAQSTALKSTSPLVSET